MGPILEHCTKFSKYSSSTVELLERNWRINPARRLRAGFRKFSKKKIHASRVRGAAARVWQFTLPGSRLGTLPPI